MADIDFFDALTGRYTWAQDGATNGWESAQYKLGWATIGDTKPSAAQFNATHQLIDKKVDWIYAQLENEADNQGITRSKSMVDLITQILDQRDNKKWPVGSIYFNASDATNPGAFLPGTWQKIASGFLYPEGAPNSGAVGHQGGSATYTLTIGNLPSHSFTGTTASAGSHNHTGTTTWDGAHTHGYKRANAIDARDYKPGDSMGGYENATTDAAGNHRHTFTTTTNGSHTHTFTTNNLGGGQAFDKMPPFVTVYMWKRIS